MRKLHCASKPLSYAVQSSIGYSSKLNPLLKWALSGVFTILFAYSLSAQAVVTKTAGVASVPSGGCITYELLIECSDIRNPCTGVTLTDTLAPGIVFVNTAPATIRHTYDPVTGIIIWDIGTMDAGSNLTISFDVCLPEGTMEQNAQVINNARVSDDVSTDIGTATVDVITAPDWGVTKSAGGPIYHDQPVTYTIMVCNGAGTIGTQNLYDVTITDELPAGAQFISASGGGMLVGNTVTWEVDTLDVTKLGCLSFNVVVVYPATDLTNNDTGFNPGTPIPKPNTAELIGTPPDGPGDPTPTPFTASGFTGAPLLPPTFTVAAGKSVPDEGILVFDSTSTFGLTFNNGGTQVLVDLTVIDEIPPEVSLVEIEMAGCAVGTPLLNDVMYSITLDYDEKHPAVSAPSTTTIGPLDNSVGMTIDVSTYIDTSTQYITTVTIVYDSVGPGWSCSASLLVTDGMVPDVMSSTGWYDNSGVEYDFCDDFENCMTVDAQSTMGFPGVDIDEQSACADMAIVPRVARLAPAKTVSVAYVDPPPGMMTTGGAYFQGSRVQYCVTFENDASADEDVGSFMTMTDVLGTDILPDYLDFDDGDPATLEWWVSSDNTGRYTVNDQSPSINFTNEADAPGAGQTRLTWRFDDDFPVGDQVVICFYATIDNDAPHDMVLTNNFCLNTNTPLFCDDNTYGKPNNHPDIDSHDPTHYIPQMDIDNMENVDICCKSVSLTVRDSTAVPYIEKTVVSSGPYLPTGHTDIPAGGTDTIEYEIVIQNALTANVVMPNPQVMDLLSDKVTLVPSSISIVENTTPLILDAMGGNPAYQFIPGFSGDQDLMHWEFDGNFGIGELVRIRFKAVINVGESGTVGNIAYAYTPDEKTECRSPITDVNDLNLNGNMLDQICQSFNATVSIVDAASISSSKWVMGPPDTAWLRGDDIATTFPGDTFLFRMVLFNAGNIPMDQLTVFDILPFVGDIGVRTGQERLSEWRPYLEGPITPPAGCEIFYSTEDEPCRNTFPIDVNETGPVPCTTATWLTAAQVTDWAAIQSFYFHCGALVLQPADTLEVIWRMRAPLNSPPGVACNSFAYRSDRLDNNVTLKAEPILACVQLEIDTIGNYVWIDTNGDGVQDADEDPIPGVTMALFDRDGNLVATTTTDVNGEYYFTNADDVANGPQMWLPGGRQYVSPQDTFYVVAAYDLPNMTGANDGPSFVAPDDEIYFLTLEDSPMSNDSTDNDGSVGGAGDPAFMDGLIYQVVPTGPAVADTTIDFGFLPGIPDLALRKVIDSPDPVVPGDNVSFTITVFNQGTVITDSVKISDYIPAGFSFDPLLNADWMLVDDTAMYWITTPIDTTDGMDSANVNIVLTVEPGATLETMINFAEISEWYSETGTRLVDVDSDPDSNPGNDPGGDPFGPSDNEVGENGKLGGDEDDHDPAWPNVFDLALIKTTAHAAPVAPGDIVTFTITVENQGTIAAANVEITDYLPAGFSLSPTDLNGWTQMGPSTVVANIAGPIDVGLQVTLDIDLVVLPSNDVADLINVAEISGAEDTNGQDMTNKDIDSDTDNNLLNDGVPLPGEPDDNNFDGKGPLSGEDEDDSDPATVPYMDMALIKETAELGPVMPGDDVTFTITIENQGVYTVGDVTVTDYIPAGFELSAADANGWAPATASVVTATIAGPITQGEQRTIDIVLTVLTADDPSDYINVAEISTVLDPLGNDISDTDIDSKPDQNPYDDMGGVVGTPADNHWDDNGSDSDGDGIKDEDDHDPATVPVEWFDLALTKILAPGQVGVVMPGDDVDFLIEVCNQGTITAANIAVVDYPPLPNMTLSATDPYGWTDANGDGNPENTIPGTLAPGDCAQVLIRLTVDPGFAAPGDLTNWGEIASATDEAGGAVTDVDSEPGGANDDTYGKDNVNDDDGMDGDGDGIADEDDHDPAFVTVSNDPIFDLALQKILHPTQPTPVYVGDDVVFQVIVINQGSEDAYNVVVSDYMPSSFDLSVNDANGWTDNDNDGVYQVLIPELLAGQQVTIDLVLTVLPSAVGPGDLENFAEISYAEDVNGLPGDDIDSTPDNIDDNDEYMPLADNVVNEDGTVPGEDEDDHDPAIVPLEVFDLALVKALCPGQPSTVVGGQDVCFEIKVCNQGTIDALNIDVVDYIPDGMVLSANDANGWVDSNADGIYENVVGGVPVGQCATVNILLTVTTGRGDLVNFSEIADAEDPNGQHPDDIDSTPDAEDDNDAGGVPGGPTDNQEDGNGTDDEDDHDPALVTVEFFDLALTKVLSPGQPATVNPGDDVSFTITVFNQGTIDALNVEVSDYIPAGFTLSVADLNGWTDVNMDGIYENTIPGIIPAWGMATLEILLTVDPLQTIPSELVNWAEISAYTDDMGNVPPDVDSRPDQDDTNDAYGNDNHVDDDGQDTDGDGVRDEDDHDPAEVFINDMPTFDLALTKILDPAQVTPVYVGSIVKFIIEVTNQGNVPASSIEVTDYIPAGLAYVPGPNFPTWSYIPSPVNVAVTSIAGPLAPGATVPVEIFLQIDGSVPPGVLVNYAEISDATDVSTGMPGIDIDSDPGSDSPAEREVGPGHPDDNMITEGGPNAGEDEDDHDPAWITYNEFDLALEKKLAPGNASPIYPGEDVMYYIVVHNQGTIDAYEIDVTDFLPAELSLSLNDTNGWTPVGPNATNTIPGPLAAGANDTLYILVTVDPNLNTAGDIVNYAEIADAEDIAGNHPPDKDSDPGSDGPHERDVQPGDPDDNNILGDYKNNGEDEDDHDPALISPEIFDLALMKALPAGAPDTYMPGDDVTFEITIINQGTVPATNIEVVDYIPAGMTYSVNDLNGWVDSNGDGSYEKTIAGPLAPLGGTETIEIVLTIDAAMPFNMMLTNFAEIASAEDDMGNMPPDTDSQPDDNDANDGPAVDDEVNQDGNIPGEDEDDHDLAEIMLGYFDLALIKELSPGQPVYVMPGADVSFTITVMNQGNIDATGVQVTEYIPVGFTLSVNDINGWADTNLDGLLDNAIPGTIPAGGSAQLELILTLDPAAVVPSELTNWAEISAALDDMGNPGNDVDSQPDAVDGDPFGSDDQTDGDGTVDEDDHDPAMIIITDQEIFDLALRKKLRADQTGPFTVGADVVFTIEVINQGTITAQNIDVMDYIPAGFILSPADGNGWTPVGTDAMNTIPGPLAPGDIDTLEIVLQIDGTVTQGPLVNFAEISAAEDDMGMPGDDIDSDPDADNTNDMYTASDDNVVSEDGMIDGEDEDDHDPAEVVLDYFDLALNKVIYHGQPTAFMPGQDVTFAINVYNQGTIDAYNVLVTDYIPTGLTLSINDTNGWLPAGANAQATIPGPIFAGGQYTLKIVLTIDPAIVADMNLINFAEITSAEDIGGGNPVDVDSQPDDVNGNDTGGGPNTFDDDEVDEDGLNDGDDEDDHDPEDIYVVINPVYDLALTKILTPGQSYPFAVGDDVAFEIKVYNQGTNATTNIEVTEYMPVGTSVSVNNTVSWTDYDLDGYVEHLITGPINPGECVIIPFVLTLDAIPDPLTLLVNEAEITAFDDEAGNPAVDFDSTPDMIQGNDPGGNPYDDSDNETNGHGGDEDDHDPAVIPFFDLALAKTTDQDLPVVPGDIVTFMLEVTNQGNVAAVDIELTDYIGTGYFLSALDMNGWTQVNADIATVTVDGPLLPDSSIIVEIDLEVREGAQLQNMTNIAEISAADDPDGNMYEDLDSEYNMDPDDNEGGELGGPTDDHIDDDGMDTDGDGILDDDHHDPAIPPVFDLALRKTTEVVTPVDVGDVVRFTIEVINQGNVSATNVTITDYIPFSLALAAVPENAGWTAGPNATYIITDIINPMDTAYVDIYLEVLPSPLPIGAVNMAEISMALDNMGRDMTLFDIDSQTDDNNANDNGNDPWSDLDNEIEGDSYNGEDEDDHDQAWLVICNAVVCKSHVNLSLDQNCSVVFTPALVLSAAEYPIDFYDITITDEDGNEVDGNFDYTDLGKTFFASVALPICKFNSCWAEIVIEDKFAPVIECVSDTMSCIEYKYGYAEPIVTENCSGYELIKVDEKITAMDCDTMFQKLVTQKWIAIDHSGNISDTCVQSVYIERFPLDSITRPVMDTILYCDSGYKTDAVGLPHPEVLGIPKLDTLPLWPMQDFFCNIWVEYEDLYLGQVQCTKKYMRTWKVTEWWCTSDDDRIYQQFYYIVDTVGPVVNIGPDTIHAKAGIRSCDATVDLPVADITDACHSIEDVEMVYPGGIKLSQNGGYVTLPVGINEVVYRAWDSCYNMSTDTLIVVVKDQVAPIAICDQNTVVSLDNDGLVHVYAEIFDDGSFDECHLEKMEVRRMDDPCGGGTDEWGDYVEFCCFDCDRDDIRVLLRVTDKSGNSGTCMVNVTVQDKIPPRVVPLPDITIDCRYDWDSTRLNEFGTYVFADSLRQPIVIPADSINFSGPALDGVVYDNCPPVMKDSFDISGVSNCGYGEIVRWFTFFDLKDNMTGQYVQTIEIVRHNPFDSTQIVWPGHIDTMNVCGASNFDPSRLDADHAYPIFIDEDECSQVGYDYKDELIDPTLGAEACFKIIRHWTVIDWCQNVNGRFARWTYDQIIEVSNTMPPMITSDCIDTVRCVYNVRCEPDSMTLTATGADDCTAEEFLYWTYKIDLGNDGSFDIIGHESTVSDLYPIDTHRVKWIVEDLCGNMDSCEYLFEIRNCKAPTAYCKNGLVAELTPIDTSNNGTYDIEQAEIWAIDFDEDSGHECGHDVILSFSEDTTDVVRYYDCDSLMPSRRDVWIWVTDKVTGNTSRCKTFILVQDNNQVDICSTGFRGNITGLVHTEDDKMVEETEVSLDNSGMNPAMTNKDGEYAFMDMPLGGGYLVNPDRDFDYTNGVSTADLVAIQRHLLGKGSLDSPYKLIAADVNRSNSVSAADISELRKLILGVFDDFPKNQSWRFVDEAYVFPDPTDPWSEVFPEFVDIPDFSKDVEVNFVATKIGDVTGDVEVGGISGLQTRAKRRVMLEDGAIRPGNTYEVMVSMEDLHELEGYQFTLEWNADYLEFMEVMPNLGMGMSLSSFGLNRLEEGVITTSWFNEKDAFIKEGDNRLFVLRFVGKKAGQLSSLVTVSSKVTKKECYVGQTVEDLELTFRGGEENRYFALYQNEPNPWTSETKIGFHLPQSGSARLTLYDETGRLIKTIEGNYIDGYNEIIIRQDELNGKGVLYYQLDTKDHTATRKMVLIE